MMCNWVYLTCSAAATFCYGMNMCKKLPSQRPHCVSVVDWKPPAHAVDCIDSDLFGLSTP